MLIIQRENIKKKPNILKQTFLLLKLMNDCETSINQCSTCVGPYSAVD